MMSNPSGDIGTARFAGTPTGYLMVLFQGDNMFVQLEARMERGGSVWWPWWSEFRQSPEVLGDCCKQEFVSHTAWISQPQTRHPENAFEVSNEHLDLLAAMPGTLVSGLRQ
jgi:hypothetical protein